MKSLIFFLVFISNQVSSGLISKSYSLAESLHDAKKFPQHQSVMMLDSGAPTGTLIHPMVAITCAHATYKIGAQAAVINRDGKVTFLTYVRQALIPEAYKQATQESLRFTNMKFLSDIANRCKACYQQAGLSPSFMQFIVERGIEELMYQKGSRILDAKESENDIQLLFLNDAIPADVIKPVMFSTNLPNGDDILQSVSFGPIYGVNGVLRSINKFKQQEPLLRHIYRSFATQHNGKTIDTKFLDAPTPTKQNKLGSIVPGDSGSPVFVYDEEHHDWLLQGLNVASYNSRCTYEPGIQATICDTSHLLPWISQQIGNIVSYEKEGYQPQLAFENREVSMLKAQGQDCDASCTYEIYPNEESFALVNLNKFDAGSHELMVSTQDFESQRHTLIVGDHKDSEKIIRAHTRENGLLELDWYKNQQPGSVLVRVKHQGSLIKEGYFGGTMGLLNLEPGQYDVSVQLNSKEDPVRFQFQHFSMPRLMMASSYVVLRKARDQTKLFKGWVNSHKGLNMGLMEDGVYTVHYGNTTLPEKMKMIVVDRHLVPHGYVVIEPLHDAVDQVALTVEEVKSDFLPRKDVSVTAYRLAGTQIPEADQKITPKAALKIPYGQYNFVLSSGGYTTEVHFQHYIHPIVKASFMSVYDQDRKEVMYLATDIGQCHKIDLSLLHDGQFQMMAQDSNGSLRRLSAVVAHHKFPSHAVLADLTNDEHFDLNWFSSARESNVNFLFGTDEDMYKARMMATHKLRWPRNSSLPLKIESKSLKDSEIFRCVIIDE